MRLTEDRIEAISKKIVKTLRDEKMLRLKGMAARAETEIQRVVTEDLRIEDEINAEVERQIDSMSRNIPYGSAEWQATFTQLKDRLSQQRGYLVS